MLFESLVENWSSWRREPLGSLEVFLVGELLAPWMCLEKGAPGSLRAALGGVMPLPVVFVNSLGRVFVSLCFVGAVINYGALVNFCVSGALCLGTLCFLEFCASCSFVLLRGCGFTWPNLFTMWMTINNHHRLEPFAERNTCLDANPTTVGPCLHLRPSGVAGRTLFERGL